MLCVTIDIDWAPEPAVEQTLDFFLGRGIIPTVFTTHRSSCIEAHLAMIEVGLHPFFHPSSSHGTTIEQTVATVMSFPHNIPAFRCHRYACCNESKQQMVQAGMCVSSNVCTALEEVPPFFDRNHLIEVPIFFEDGGYLRHYGTRPLPLMSWKPHLYVVNIHPMHFVLNTPHFDWMIQLKRRLTRAEWNSMDREALDGLKYSGRGIRQVIEELVASFDATAPLMKSLEKSPKFSTKIGCANALSKRQ